MENINKKHYIIKILSCNQFINEREQLKKWYNRMNEGEMLKIILNNKIIIALQDGC